PPVSGNARIPLTKTSTDNTVPNQDGEATRPATADLGRPAERRGAEASKPAPARLAQEAPGACEPVPAPWRAPDPPGRPAAAAARRVRGRACGPEGGRGSRELPRRALLGPGEPHPP